MDFARSAPLRTAIGVGVATLLVAVVAVIGVIGVQSQYADSMIASQGQRIRAAVDDHTAVANYTLDYESDPEAVTGYHLTVMPSHAATPETMGTFLALIFSPKLDVAQVEIQYAAPKRLLVTRAERDAKQWSSLVTATERFDRASVQVGQFGPEGVASYRIDIEATCDDVVTTYEGWHREALPEWASIGEVHLGTTDGVWPQLRVDAERPIAPAEWDAFHEQVRQMRAQVGADENYAVHMRIGPNSEAPDFDRFVVPDGPPEFDLRGGSDRP